MFILTGRDWPGYFRRKDAHADMLGRMMYTTEPRRRRAAHRVVVGRRLAAAAAAAVAPAQPAPAVAAAAAIAEPVPRGGWGTAVWRPDGEVASPPTSPGARTGPRPNHQGQQAAHRAAVANGGGWGAGGAAVANYVNGGGWGGGGA